MSLGKLKRALAVAALLTSACSAPDSEPAAAPPAAALYQRNCASCHGPEGEGRQVGAVTVPSIREGRPASYTDERLFQQIYNGGNGMPPFKYSLTDDEITALARFVREHIQRRAAPAR